MKAKIFLALCVSFVVSGCSDNKTEQAEKESSSRVSMQPVVKDQYDREAEAAAERKRVASALPRGDVNTQESAYCTFGKECDLYAYQYALSGEATDYNRIAEIIIPKFRDENDQFKRQDMIANVKSDIDKTIEAAKQKRYIKLFLSQNEIDPYSFEKSGFALKHSLNEDVYFSEQNRHFKGPAFAIPTTGFYLGVYPAQNISFISVKDQNVARKIEGLRNLPGKLQLVVYGYAQQASEKGNRIRMEILKFRFLDEEGNLIYESIVG